MRMSPPLGLERRPRGVIAMLQLMRIDCIAHTLAGRKRKNDRPNWVWLLWPSEEDVHETLLEGVEVSPTATYREWIEAIQEVVSSRELK